MFHILNPGVFPVLTHTVMVLGSTFILDNRSRAYARNLETLALCLKI